MGTCYVMKLYSLGLFFCFFPANYFISYVHVETYAK